MLRIFLLCFAIGCSGSTTPDLDAASLDATTDATTDATIDAMKDATTDAMKDATPDGSPCPPCGPKQVCCDQMGPGYGYCYAEGCLACCGQ